MKKLSTGFANGSTKQFKGVDREVESRLKRLDVFTDDFAPPGVSEKFPGGDFSKRNAPYEDRHSDNKKLHNPGSVKEQQVLDDLDAREQAFNAPIKNPYDSFPGALNFNQKSEVGAFDKHQTDPTRLKKMAVKETRLRSDVGPEEFDKRVETRMKMKMDGGFKADSYGGESETATQPKGLVSATGDADNPDLHDQRVSK